MTRFYPIPFVIGLFLIVFGVEHWREVGWLIGAGLILVAISFEHSHPTGV